MKKSLAGMLILILIVGLSFSSGVSHGSENGDWLWLYDFNHRETPDDALGMQTETVWHAAIILDLSDRQGDYLTEVAYYDFMDGGDWARAYISSDDETTPGGLAPEEPWQARSENYTPAGNGWVELELEEPLEIVEDEYWIVMEFHDYGSYNFPIGFYDDHFVDDGQWTNTVDPFNYLAWVDQEEMDDGAGAWGLEAKIEEGPELSLNDWSIDVDSPRAGEYFEIQGEVSNTGDFEGSDVVEFYIDGEVISSEEIQVDEGSSRDVVFEYQLEESKTYDLEVILEDSGKSWSVSLEVEPGEVDEVELSPLEDQTIDEEEKIEFSAAAYDEYGNLITDDPEDFEWKNANPSGVFEKDESGEYKISASYNGVVSEEVAVEVEGSIQDIIPILILGGILLLAAAFVIYVFFLREDEKDIERPMTRQTPMVMNKKDSTEETDLSDGVCPDCQANMRFVDEFDRWYCDRCEEYK